MRQLLWFALLLIPLWGGSLLAAPPSPQKGKQQDKWEEFRKKLRKTLEKKRALERENQQLKKKVAQLEQKVRILESQIKRLLERLKPSPLERFLHTLRKAWSRIFSPRPSPPRPRPRPRPSSPPQIRPVPPPKAPSKTPKATSPQLERARRLAGVFRERGIEFYRRNELKRAIGYFSTALNYWPKDEASLLYRGLCHYQLGQFTQALADFTKALQIQKRPKTYLLRAQTYGKLGKYVQAKKDLSRAIQLAPNLTEAYFQRGNLALRQRHFPQAERDYKKVLSLSPNHIGAAYNLACTYALWGKKQLAIQWLRKAIQKGYSNLEHMRRDPDLKSLQNEPEFQALFRKQWR